MNKSVLLFAGSGFLGKNLINVLQDKGYQVGCADIADPGISDICFHSVDILKDNVVSLQSIINKYDIVINCSGQVTNPINTCLRLNTEGIDKLVTAVKEEDKFLIHFSTVTVYGSCDFASEASPKNPETPYSSAKAFSEFLIEKSLAPERFCILRLSNLYGEGQPKGVFSYLYRSYNSDRVLVFNNDGFMVRYYLHVHDCASLVALLLEQQLAGVYNLIGRDKFTIRDLVQTTSEITNCIFDTSFNNVKAWDNTIEISDEKLKSVIPVVYENSIEGSLKKLFHNRN